MSAHTTKNATSGKATWSFYNDDDTGVDSDAANQVDIMCGGTIVATYTTAVQVLGAGTVVDLNGVADALVIDADADTTISAPTDDQIDIEIAGADDFTFTANTFTALSGSTIATNTIAETTATSGVTIDGVLVKDGGVDLATGTLTMDGGTGTASSDAVTISKPVGVITTESKTSAAGATYTITLTNTLIAATSIVLVNVNVNAGTGTPVVTSVTPGSGSCTIVVQNVHASVAFNTAHKLMFLVVLP